MVYGVYGVLGLKGFIGQLKNENINLYILHLISACQTCCMLGESKTMLGSCHKAGFPRGLKKPKKVLNSQRYCVLGLK